MTSRRRFVVVAILLAVLGASCGGSPASPDTSRTVTVVLDWTPNTNHAGVYLAKLRGYYDTAGITVDIVEPDQNGALAQIAAGNGAFGFAAAEQLIPMRAQGSRLRSVATVLQTNTSSLLAPSDRKIVTPRDLANNTYGGYGADLERALIETLMRCDGADPSTVMFTEVGNVDYSVGFRRGHYDAVWVYDGWDAIRLRDVQRLSVTTIAFRDHLDCIPDWYTPVIVTRDDLLSSEPDLVRDFLAATARGYQDLARDPVASVDEITATMDEADPQLWRRSAQFLAPYLLDDAQRFGVQSPTVWSTFNSFLAKNNLPAVTAADELFSNEFLPEK